jgi:catechol 2,3-dioxygenase-like lactoylglutathione lyase family enzyme
VFSHILVGSNNLAASKHFYDAIFSSIGWGTGVHDPWGRLIYLHGGAKFLVTTPINGKPAVSANGSTVGFGLMDAAQVDAWHKAGVSHGGTAIEDPPGVRTTEIGNFYLAYLLDPDGNKLCAQYEIPN